MQIPTEKEIQDKIFLNIAQGNVNAGHFKFTDVCCNIHFFDWESDVLFKDSDGYLWEIEIKRSLEDYQRDFEKAKHDLFEEYYSNQNRIPSFFYFALPNGMIDPNEVPEYAGLIQYQYIDGALDFHWTIKAPKISNRKASPFDTIRILRKQSLQYWRKRVGKIPFPK